MAPGKEYPDFLRRLLAAMYDELPTAKRRREKNAQIRESQWKECMGTPETERFG